MGTPNAPGAPPRRRGSTPTRLTPHTPGHYGSSSAKETHGARESVPGRPPTLGRPAGARPGVSHSYAKGPHQKGSLASETVQARVPLRWTDPVHKMLKPAASLTYKHCKQSKHPTTPTPPELPDTINQAEETVTILNPINLQAAPALILNVIIIQALAM